MSSGVIRFPGRAPNCNRLISSWCFNHTAPPQTCYKKNLCMHKRLLHTCTLCTIIHPSIVQYGAESLSLSLTLYVRHSETVQQIATLQIRMTHTYIHVFTYPLLSPSNSKPLPTLPAYSLTQIISCKTSLTYRWSWGLLPVFLTPPLPPLCPSVLPSLRSRVAHFSCVASPSITNTRLAPRR